MSLPSWRDLAELRKLLTPKLVPFLYGGKVVGTSAGLQDCLRLHLQRLVQTGQAAFLATEQSSLVCNVTIGVDGRGSEKVGWKTLQSRVSCLFVFSPDLSAEVPSRSREHALPLRHVRADQHRPAGDRRRLLR